MIFWKIAWRNLLRHRRRNATTMLAIAFGFSGVALLGGYMLHMEGYLATQAIYLYHSGHLSVYKKDGLERSLVSPEKSNLSPDDQHKITAALAELHARPEFVGSYLRGQGLVSNGCHSLPFLMLASDPESEARAWSHPEVKKWIPELAQLQKGKGFWEPGVAPDAILVTEPIARALDKPLVAGDAAEDRAAMDTIVKDCQDAEARKPISRHSGIQLIGNTFSRGFAGADARIGGIFSTGLSMTNESALIAPLGLAQKFFDTDDVTWMAIYLPQGASVTRARRELQEIFRSHGYDYAIYPYDDDRVSPYYVGAMSFVYVMVMFFLILICGIVTLSVLNALQISFLERRTEVGSLRALGFRPSAVTKLFVCETALLAAISLLLGDAVTIAIAAFINRSNLRFQIVGTAGTIQFMLNPEPLFMILIGVILFAVALGSALFACSRWAKQPIVSLLEQAK